MLKKFLLVFLLVLLSLSATAYDFEVDRVFYNTISAEDLICEVTFKEREYASYSGDIVIPANVTYKGRTFTVTSIGEEAFFVCSDMTSVEIPNSIISISKQSFAGCSSLTNVVIPNSVTSIGMCAFYECSDLLSVSIPETITSIESETFGFCLSLTNVEIPNSVRSIGNGAFYYCSSLTSMTIPNSVKVIEESAFMLCSNLESVTIGKSVNSIGNAAFYDCSALRQLTLFTSVPPRIYDNTFEGVSKVDVTVKVPNEAVSKYKNAEYWKAFWNIVSLESEPGDYPPTKKCAQPRIELKNGMIYVSSTTEGSECCTSITPEDFKSVNGNEPIVLTGIYNITSYAYAEGFQNSEITTAFLIWGNPELQTDGLMTIEEKKAVLLNFENETINLSGLELGENVQLYDISGRLIENINATDCDMSIGKGLQKKGIYILKLGETTVKVKI